MPPTHPVRGALSAPTSSRRGSVPVGLMAGVVILLGGVFVWQVLSMGAPSRGLELALALGLTLIALAVLIHSLRVTGRLRALEAVTAEQRYALNTTLPQLRALWDKAPLSIMLLEPNDPKIPVKIVDCNPMACATHGYTREELIGNCIDLIEGVPWTAQHADGWISGLRDNRRMEGESQHKRKDGTLFWIEYFTSLVRVDGREMVIGMDRDATARKAAEQALNRERILTRALLLNIPDHVYCKDRESKFLIVSRSLAARFGLKDPEEAGGKSDSDFFTAEHARQALEDEQRIIATGQPLLDVMEKETWDDGRVTWGLTTKTPMRNETGEIIGTCGITKDITQIKEAEDLVKQAKEAAEAADRAKSEFLAVMSHEIRTPMNGVLGFTNLLLDTQLTPEQRDWLHTIHSSGESLLTLINDILDFSKIESGRMELEQQPVSVRRCVEEVLDLLWSKANEKKIELLQWFEADVPEWIISDATRLRQVLVNLVGNAIKFTHHGEVEVRVSVETPAPGRPDRLIIAIRDTGEGVPADRIGRLFRAFSQADSSTTRRFGGTGLGLAISRSLAQLLGGDIELASTSELGSCFRFTILGAPCPAPAELAEFARITHPTVALHGRHALIVDDNEANRRILTSQLQRWGMLTHACEHADEAIAYVGQNPAVEMALLDMMMPDMNGVELAARLHALPGRENLPLLLLSSVSREELRAYHPTDHFRAVLTKPVRQAALLDAMNQVCSNKREADPGTSTAAGSRIDSEFGQRHPRRILVAEDNVVNQKLITGLLRRLGYQPQLVTNGVACLEDLRRQAYDVVLMDCQMPEMDGYEATARVREGEAGERNRELFVIALTASAMVGDRERCLNAGMNDYLTKPIQAAELIRLLEASPVLADDPPAAPV